MDSIDWFIEKLYKNKNNNEAIIYKDTGYTYDWLIDEVDKWYKIIKEEKITSGHIVSIEADYSHNSIALFIALIRNNNIVVPLSSMTEQEKNEFIEIAEIEYIIRFCDDEQYEIIRLNRSEIKNTMLRAFREEKKGGLILFSSGSTGKSKAILHDLSKLIKKFAIKSHKPLRTITFLLFDHIGGIDTLFDILSNYGTVIILPGRDPLTVCNTIEKHRAELLPTSPTFLNLLIFSEEYKNYDLSSLKIITYGAEPMAEITLKKLNNIFPELKLIQKYGLSEFGAIRSKSEFNESKWFKIVGDVDIKIVNNQLLIKSDTSMLGYLNAPDPFDGEGYFHTGDIVEVDGEYIKIVGRDSEIINVGGQKVFPVEVENVIMEMPEVEDVIVYGEKNPITGNIVVAKVKPEIDISFNEMKKKIRTFCKNKISGYKIPVKVIVVKELQYSLRCKKMRGNF